MSDRWVNAEITFTIPLDVPFTASVAEKAAAAEEMAERHFPEMPQDAVAKIGFRDVENGEAVGEIQRDGTQSGRIVCSTCLEDSESDGGAES